MAIRSKVQTFSSDTIYLYDDNDEFGDSSGTLGSGEVGGSDTFYVGEDGLWGEDYSATGDADYLVGTAKGGADHFYGGSHSWNFFQGDAGSLGDGALGGNDVMNIGMDSYSLLIGDAYGVYGSAKGGADSITGGSGIAQTIDPYTYSNYVVDGDAVNFISGDGYGMTDNSQGGLDTITGGSVFGIYDYYDESNVLNFIEGDAFIMEANATGAADKIYGGGANGVDAMVVNMLSGDAFGMTGNSRGGNDSITGGSSTGDDSYAVNMLAGDTFAQDPSAAVTFGADVLRGGSGSFATDGYDLALNVMSGDVGFDSYGMGFTSTPGLAAMDEVLAAAASAGDAVIAAAASMASLAASPEALFASLSAQAAEMHASGGLTVQAGPGPGDGYGELSMVKGGNDMLYGGSTDAYNFMVGDAEAILNGGSGGWDTLTGGDRHSFNIMIGDAFYIESGSRGGNDKLVSGAGFDFMVGDALGGGGIGGADTFVFASGNGEDVVIDFNPLQGDKINLSAFKRLDPDFGSVAKLLASGRVFVDGDGDVIIDTDVQGQSGNYIEIMGGGDFILNGTWFVI